MMKRVGAEDEAYEVPLMEAYHYVTPSVLGTYFLVRSSIF